MRVAVGCIASLVVVVASQLMTVGRAHASQPAIQAPAVIVGQVVEAGTSRGVGGALVVLAAGTPQPGVPAQPGSRRGVAIADGQGHFVFRDVSAGDYTITATLSGYASGATGRRRPDEPSRPITVADGVPATGVIVPVWRLASISGQVVDDLGDPMVATPVWAMRSTMAAGRQVLAFGSVELTDDRGRYRISSLMPGEYAVVIRNTTRTAAVSSVQTYNAAEAAGTTAALMSHWVESGAIRPTGVGPVVGDWQVQQQETGGSVSPVPGPDGRLLVHPSTFFAGAHHPADATIVSLRAGEERDGVDFALTLAPAARVSGILLGPDGPAPQLAVALLPKDRDGPMLPLGGEVAIATTDGGGRFVLLGVPAGDYVLHARRVPRTTPTRVPMPPQAGAPPGLRSVEALPASRPDAPTLFAELPVTVAGADLDDLSLLLAPGARLTGRVEFDGARPDPKILQQIAVSPMRLGGSMPGVGPARVDADGHFTTRGYPPGRYLLDATVPAGNWTLLSAMTGDANALVQPFVLGHRDVEGIVLTFTDRVTEITGTVQAEGRDDSTHATVVAFPADYEHWRDAGMPMGQVATAMTLPDGTYRLRIGIPGDYLIVAVPPEVTPDPDALFLSTYAPRGVRVSIALGERKVQALRLEGRR